MRILIAGATGFIGQNLCQLFNFNKHDILVLSRNCKKARIILEEKVTCLEWNTHKSQAWPAQLNNIDVFINLVGRNLSSRRWNRKFKDQLVQSRLSPAKMIVEAVKTGQLYSKLFIQVSGVDFYRSSGDKILDESAKKGTGFLTELATIWENSTRELEDMNIRRVVMRMGVVLGRGGGFLSKFLTPFKMFVGGPLGDGKQWISWIHIFDLFQAIDFFIQHTELNGTFNVASPEPVTMREFCSKLGDALNRPSWFYVPSFVLRIIFGEMADEAILSSQRVIPKRLLDSGYQFHYANIQNALSDLLLEKYG